MGRRPLAVICAALVLLAGAGAAYVTVHPGSPHHSTPTPTPTPTRAGPRSPALPDLGTAAMPLASGVAATLGRVVRARALGGSLAGLVVDARTGTQLFARGASTALPPASTVKLLTAAAALAALGSDATLSTSVVSSGRTLYLVGDGDVTLTAAARRTYPAPATLDALARRTANSLGSGATPMRLRYDTSAWSGSDTAPGWNAGYFSAGDVSHLTALEVDEARLRPGAAQRWADPAGQAAAAFARALHAHGVPVRGAPQPGTAPAAARTVGVVRSPPLAALVERMLTSSDNDLAEAVGRAVAVHDGLPPTFAGAAAAVTRELADLSVPMTGVRLLDTSGLSHLDLVTPRTLVAVLRLVDTDHRFAAIPVGLPVAGLTGTLADRYRRGRDRAAAGQVRAKTGTLAGVSALAGQVVDVDGRLLAFAFLTDAALAPTTAEHALDAIAARLAACGCS
ncbi:MAG: hypothetical protein QOF18_2242 [Frankiaceae bacterium]|nr:hypothetical protein [Frankiaceae bacterium]